MMMMMRGKVSRADNSDDDRNDDGDDDRHQARQGVTKYRDGDDDNDGARQRERG